MRLTFSAIAAVICLTIAAGLSATLVPGTPVARVRVVVSTTPAGVIVSPTTSAGSSRSATDARQLSRLTSAAIRYAAALESRDQAIRYAVAYYAARAREARAVTPRPAWVPSWSDTRFDQFAPGDTQLVLDIGRCEQPGNGWEGIDWTNHGPTYPGGLGILNVNWTRVARELGLPSPAYLASPAQQIAGAERLAADVGGWNGWGCYNAHHREWGY